MVLAQHMLLHVATFQSPITMSSDSLQLSPLWRRLRRFVQPLRNSREPSRKAWRPWSFSRTDAKTSLHDGVIACRCMVQRPLCLCPFALCLCKLMCMPLIFCISSLHLKSNNNNTAPKTATAATTNTTITIATMSTITTTTITTSA